MHPRVRHHQAALRHLQVTVEEQIEVDEPRPVLFPASSAQRLLHFKQGAKQRSDVVIGVQLGGGVQVAPLVWRTADWCRFIIRGNPVDRDSVPFPQGLQCPIEIKPPVPQVAAQGNVCDCGHDVATHLHRKYV